MLLRLALLALCISWSLVARTNVVFFLADDLGWADLGCYGSDFYETPNIDRLAADGLRFTDAYAAAHSCSPTRGSILTGRYPGRTHLTDWIPGRVPDGSKLLPPKWTNFLRRDETTIAEVLSSAGYATAAIGKWHLGHRGWWAEDQGFDVSFGGSNMGSHSTMFPPYWPADRLEELSARGISDQKPNEYLTDRLTREAERFLEDSRERPFFLYLSYYAVHTRIQGKPALVDKYKSKAPGRLHDNPEYGAMLESVDQSVGRIRKKLADLGLSDNTMIIFFSDNGGLSKDGNITSNLPLRGEKSSMWEGGIRVPLIIQGPGVKGGRETATPVISVDFFPTIMDWAEIEADLMNPIDGKSLTPLLAGRKMDRGPIYWHSPHYNAHTPIITTTPYGAVREGDWKLIEFFEDSHTELYNLAKDISETRDLSRQQPERAQKLLARLKTWRREVGAQMPIPNPNADPARYREYKEKRLWKSVAPYDQQTTFEKQ